MPHPLSAPNLTELAAPAALTPSELAARQVLSSRLAEVCGSTGRAVAEELGVGALLDRPPAECRLADLAVAVFRLENLLAPARAPLPDVHVVDPDDALRHPGFDGVEQEAFDEEAALLAHRPSGA